MDAKTIRIGDPALYINRELSLLEFNRRVLELAKDEQTPLLERLKFLCIASSNLDEFFEIRVAGLKEQIALVAGQHGPDQMAPQDQLRAISAGAHALVAEQYRVLNDVLLPQLAEANIHFLKRTEWNNKQAAWVRRFFNRELMPMLTPIRLATRPPRLVPCPMLLSRSSF